MKISPEVLNRLEELDVLILDHNGNPIAFTRKFSMYVDSFYIEPDIELAKYSNGVFKDIFKNYIGDKIKPRENIKLYCKIILQILGYIAERSESCEDFRQVTLKRLRL